jgi:endonuclease YncB( thermonuclease family)
LKTFLLILISIWVYSVEDPTSVIRVVDDDTIETEAEKVRLLYIDTPESKANSHGPAMVEGKAATEFLEKSLPKGAIITLWGPGEQIEKDRYGRLLTVVWLNAEMKQDVNLAIIKAGWSPILAQVRQCP